MKTVLIDLDGVLNTYRGNYDPNFVPSIKDGAKEFLETLSQNYEIKIFTTREKTSAENWVKENGLSHLVSGVTNYKEPCYLFVDDRAVKFENDYAKTLQDITNFKPWWQ